MLIALRTTKDCRLCGLNGEAKCQEKVLHFGLHGLIQIIQRRSTAGQSWSLGISGPSQKRFENLFSQGEQRRDSAQTIGSRSVTARFANGDDPLLGAQFFQIVSGMARLVILGGRSQKFLNFGRYRPLGAC